MKNKYIDLVKALKDRWNAEADGFNQWDNISEEEKTEIIDSAERLIVAFMQGANHWEYIKEGATMWPSDRDSVEREAIERLKNGTLGKSVEERLCLKRKKDKKSKSKLTGPEKK